MKSGVLGALVLVVWAAAAAQAPSRFEPVYIGVLREDAVLFPIARFNGTTWRTGWRASDVAGAGDSMTAPPVAEIPRAWWAGGPPARSWELLRKTGERQQLRVIGTSVWEAVSLLLSPEGRDLYARRLGAVRGQEIRDRLKL